MRETPNREGLDLVQKERFIRLALIVSAIGIPLDIITTWSGLSTNPDLRETGSLIILCIQYFELVPGLIIGGLVNIIITVRARMRTKLLLTMESGSLKMIYNLNKTMK